MAPNAPNEEPKREAVGRREGVNNASSETRRLQDSNNTQPGGLGEVSCTVN